MSTILSLVAFACLVAFIVGLVKPALVKMPSRKKSSAVYGIAFFVLCWISGAYFTPAATKDSVNNTTPKVEESEKKLVEPVFKFADVTLGKFKNSPVQERHEMVGEYVRFKSVPEIATEDFYACMSEYSVTKDKDLNLEDVLGWCNASYTSDPKSLSQKINLDAFLKNFSGWDGSYRPLEKLIKRSMNDDSSYKHVETSYSLFLVKDPHAVVNTTFRGSNQYGGIVKQTVSARVNIRSGEIEKILEN